MYVGFNLPVGEAVESANVSATKTDVNDNVRALKIDRYIASHSYPQPIEYKQTLTSDSKEFKEWNSFVTDNQKDMSEALATTLSFPIGEVKNKTVALPEYIIKGINEYSDIIIRLHGGDNMGIHLNPTSSKQPTLELIYDKSVVYKALENYKTYADAVMILEELGESIPTKAYTITDVDVSTQNGTKAINSVTVRVNTQQNDYEPQVIAAIYNSETGILEAVKITENEELKNANAGHSVKVLVDGCSKEYSKYADEYYSKVFIMDLNNGFVPLAQYTYAD